MTIDTILTFWVIIDSEADILYVYIYIIFHHDACIAPPTISEQHDCDC
jgi:hypothetical protein